MTTETELLRGAGHDVGITRISSPLTAASELRDGMERVAPDIVHVQNFFPSVLPRHYRMIRSAGVPIVQSVRNYRLTCVSANRWREGAACSLCSIDHHSPGIRHGCYRGSRAQSLVAAELLRRHQRRDTWTSTVSAFIAVSSHVRDSLTAEVAPTPVMVKPNTVVTDVVGSGSADEILYVGRLSVEKGIEELARTWSTEPELPPLAILGDGPLRGSIEAIAASSTNVRYEGQSDHGLTLQRMADARATIAPWRWVEPFGRSLMESLAVGTPVLVSAAAAQLFEPADGALVPADPSDADSLRSAVGTLTARGDARDRARRYFVEHFDPGANLQRLVEIYRTCIAATPPGEQHTG